MPSIGNYSPKGPPPKYPARQTGDVGRSRRVAKGRPDGDRIGIQSYFMSQKF
ncbi:hypothetical protein [Lyngbya sp. CCY1209]|uniref:hypothetical protein n=1 Tax=Lyngbya sp. CCY1209 TaxID=2886103 RepID=UPI002D1FF8E9|nr:hypothetical protein [Lyngbya sp. CCY1209]MEB3887097.1 hypothetical protein [Lyngbya sp. CCY1209]